MYISESYLRTVVLVNFRRADERAGSSRKRVLITVDFEHYMTMYIYLRINALPIGRTSKIPTSVVECFDS